MIASTDIVAQLRERFGEREVLPQATADRLPTVWVEAGKDARCSGNVLAKAEFVVYASG